MVECVELLIKIGFCINLQDQFGYTDLLAVCIELLINYRSIVLMYHCEFCIFCVSTLESLHVLMMLIKKTHNITSTDHNGKNAYYYFKNNIHI